MPPLIKSTPLIAIFFILSALFIWFPAMANDEHDHATHETEIVQAKVTNEYCPVIPDEKVDPSISVEYKGKRVFLCCNMCRRDFLENPEAYIDNLPQFASEVQTSHEITSDDHHQMNEEERHESNTSPSPEHHHDGETQEMHDHATDHGESDASGLGKLVNFAGKFHPVVVHFPIALGLAALLAEILALFTKAELFRAAARFSIVTAALGALVAVPLGWQRLHILIIPSLKTSWNGIVGLEQARVCC